MNFPEARLSELTMEIHIDADAERVWAALTENIGQWWPGAFFAGGEDGSRRFHLEAQPGGRMYEEWDDGGGLLWGTVITVEPAGRLQIVGFGFPNWGGPSQFFADWDLEPDDSGTRLRFSEHAIGRVSESYTAEKDKGWMFLLEAMKAHIEGKPAPVWTD